MLSPLVFLLVALSFVRSDIGTRNHIYLYNDTGAGAYDNVVLFNSLRRNVHSSYNVTTISAREVLAGKWPTTAAAFVAGSGYDLGIISALGEQGATLIRNYVHNGGSYLGLGSGASYACDYIEYDKGGKQEVLGHRSLKFFPGVGIGPVFGTYNYHDKSGARAAPIEFFEYHSEDSRQPFRNTSLMAYFNGGDLFTPYSAEEHNLTGMGRLIHNMAEYVEFRTHPAAIVKCNAGRGHVVLSGVKVEYRIADMQHDDPYLQPIIQQLTNHDAKVQHIFCTILRELGLTVTCN